MNELTHLDDKGHEPAGDRVRCVVLTLSDRRSAGKGEDLAGPAVCEILKQGFAVEIVRQDVLPDEQSVIEQALLKASDVDRCDLVVTTGGTGIGPRDVTPEATRAIIDREIPGMAEAMRAVGLGHTARAMLSRGICGSRKQTIIINLSGSPKAVREQLTVLMPVLPHALEVISGATLDCGR